MEKLRVFEAFAGYGSQSIALRSLGIPHEVVAISEIDKYAIQAYNVLHGETLNLGDISKINPSDIPDHDLFTYSFPCQDISNAGLQRGFDRGSGTRSGLLWECEKVIQTKKPKYLLMENVKNLISKKFKRGFDEWCEWLERQGYKNFYKVLNAKDYGIPQNRERVFMISILDENATYEFPEKLKLNKNLIDFLETEIPEKYYLSLEKCSGLILKSNIEQSELATDWKQPKCIIVKEDVKGAAIRGRYDDSGKIVQRLEVRNDNLTNTLTTVQKDNVVLVREATKQGYAEAIIGDSINLEHPNSKTRRGRVGHKVAQTLTTSCNQATLDENYNIRKLTQRECLRLMGLKDFDIDKLIKSGISDTQLYKLAGNSIVVDVLEHIFKELFKEYID